MTAQKGALFGHECGGDHVPPNSARSADFQFLGGDVSANRSGNDDGIGAHILTGDASRLADDEHAAQGDLAFEGAFNADAARAVDAAVPDDARAQHRSNAFDSLYRLESFSGSGIALEHVDAILP